MSQRTQKETKEAKLPPKVAKKKEKGCQKLAKGRQKGAKRRQVGAKGRQKWAKGRPKCIDESMPEKNVEKGTTNTKKWINFGAIFGG